MTKTILNYELDFFSYIIPTSIIIFSQCQYKIFYDSIQHPTIVYKHVYGKRIITRLSQ